MKNIILSVLFWAVASVCLAVTLPSSSYNFYDSYRNGNESFTFSIGTSVVNYSTLGTSAYAGSCTNDGVWTGDVSICQGCCQDEFKQCMTNGGTYNDCKNLKGLCDSECDYKALNQEDSPLGETLLLLPFIAIYAVIRKRKQA